jgi:hypothetical protein
MAWTLDGLLGERHTHELYYEYVYFVQPTLDDAALFVTMCIEMPCIVPALSRTAESTNCHTSLTIVSESTGAIVIAHKCRICLDIADKTVFEVVYRLIYEWGIIKKKNSRRPAPVLMQVTLAPSDPSQRMRYHPKMRREQPTTIQPPPTPSTPTSPFPQPSMPSASKASRPKFA